MIQIDNLYKKYDESGDYIINDISFTVDKGEFVVLIGPSGCGKSTILNMVAGYSQPSSGVMLMNDRPILGPSYTRGVISQENTLLPWYNVQQNISYGLRMRNYHKKEIAERTEGILEDVDLTSYQHHKIYELSGGMKQRVALARTLVNDSELLLMDEPLGALDTLTRTSMQGLIRKLWFNKQLTVLMITHDIEEALLLATKIIVLSKRGGHIVSEFHPTFSASDDFERVSSSEAFQTMKFEIMKLL